MRAKKETEREERDKGKEKQGEDCNCHTFVATRAGHAKSCIGGFGGRKLGRKRGVERMEVGATSRLHA